MTESFSTLRVNPERMLAALNRLALIGATGDGANVLLQTVLRLAMQVQATFTT